jgi:phytoene desaturase
MKKSDTVIVIGAGLGGLAAACTLAARGHRVTLLEKNSWLGGKAAQLHQSGFRFDMGPTILLMPSALRRIFAEANRPLEDYLTLLPLEPQWRCFFADNSVLDLVGNSTQMADNLTAFSGQPTADGYARFMHTSEKMAAASDNYFFWKSIGTLRDMMNPKQSFTLQTLRDVAGLRMWSTMAKTVRKSIKDPRVAQMVDHFTQYVGSSPEASPAVLAGIGHMQTSEGIWYPKGGTRAVPLALAKLAQDLGVTIRLSTGVRRILTDNNRVTAVETDTGETLGCSAAVANSDAYLTHQKLLPNTRFRNRRSYEAACSGVVLYLGLSKRYSHLAHHDFVFSKDPHEEFHHIYKRGQPAPDPTCYLCSPAQTEPEVAPPGGDALYVLVHTPYLRDNHDWKQLLPAYRKTILQKLKTTGHMPDIESRITFEHALTPQDIHDRYHVWKGAIYGLASHGRLTGAFKPANRSPDVRGLYLAGGSAHPGPGMPMVMMSGWIAADALDHDAPPTQSLTQTPEPAEALA